MRTFHIGGAVSRAASVSQIEGKSSGTVRFTSTMRYVTNARDEKVVISRNGEFLIEDDAGRERERHKVPYGATLLVNDSKPIKVGEVIATWDPHTRPIISEYAGQVKFENVEEGITVFASGKDGIFNAGTPIGKTKDNVEVELFVDPNQLSFVTVNLIKPSKEVF